MGQNYYSYYPSTWKKRLNDIGEVEVSMEVEPGFGHDTTRGHLEEEEELKKVNSNIVIVEPETPREPMEFLSRSWSISAEEISKAIANKQNNNNNFLFQDNNNNKNYCPSSPLIPFQPSPSPTFSSPPNYLVEKMVTNNVQITKKPLGGLGKWFKNKDSMNTSLVNKKKDRARAENAHIHASISIAGLAAALAAVAAADGSATGSKMSRAVASATELLASHCIELAELGGADHDRVALAVRSAVDVRSPGDVMTLTAASATALRAEAALRARLPKEGKRNASISPYDKGFGEIQCYDPFLNDTKEDHNFPCVGQLMQHTTKGGLRWKQVSVYINKKSKVMVKLKSKNVGGAFSKKDKYLVYGVCEEMTAWDLGKEGENLETYFGLKTAQGFLEFKCKNKAQKQQWVYGIHKMLDKETYVEDLENSLQHLHNK